MNEVTPTRQFSDDMAKKKGKGKKKSEEAEGGGAEAAADGGGDEGKMAEGDPEGQAAQVERESDQVRRIRANVRSAFGFFDKEGEERVLQEEIGSVIRYLGQFPSAQTLADVIIPAIQGAEPNAYISFDCFEPFMVETMKTNAYPPEEQDVIISCFRVRLDLAFCFACQLE